MLYVPRALVFQDCIFSFEQYLEDELRDINLSSEIRNGREQGSKVEHDGARLWHAAQRLPVNVQVCIRWRAGGQDPFADKGPTLVRPSGQTEALQP